MYNVVVGNSQVRTVKAAETHGAVEAYLRETGTKGGIVRPVPGAAGLTPFGDTRFTVVLPDGIVLSATVRRKADVRYKRWTSVLA